MFLRHKSIRKQTAPLYPSSTLRQSPQPSGLSTLPEASRGWFEHPQWVQEPSPLHSGTELSSQMFCSSSICIFKSRAQNHLLWKKGHEPSSKGLLPEVGDKYPILLLEWRWHLSRALTFQPSATLHRELPGPSLGQAPGPGDPILGCCPSTGPCARNWGRTDCVKEISYSSHFIKVIFVHWKMIIM